MRIGTFRLSAISTSTSSSEPGVLPAQTPRHELIRKFRALGWIGPRPGGRHQFMVKGTHKVRIPNPHRADIGRLLLAEILRQADIKEDEWLSAK